MIKPCFKITIIKLTNWFMQISMADRRICFGRIGDFKISNIQSKYPGRIRSGRSIMKTLV